MNTKLYSLLFSALLLGVSFNTIAQDKQGKKGLEYNTARPKENNPPKSGSQRVQENAKDRTSRALNPSGSDRQREKTKSAVNKIVPKK